MPNLSLTHNGNMNITSAEITSAGTLNVAYTKNETGGVAGWTFNTTDDEFYCGNTYTITAVPQISGTVQAENFVVSGFDIAGVKRSDTSVLRQGYDSQLDHLLYKCDVASMVQWAEVTDQRYNNNCLEFDVAINDQKDVDLMLSWVNNNNIANTGYTHTTLHIDVVEPTIIIATSITLNVASAITDSGQATASYSPSGATVSLVYTSSNENLATIDPDTGEITVLSGGTVQFCVTDTVSNLSDCKYVDVDVTPEPPVTAITSLTMVVDDEIVEVGVATAEYAPNLPVSLVWTSSDESIATMEDGFITVLDNGLVTFCVRDEISGLEDCKEVLVRKAVYIDYIEIVVDDALLVSGVATANYTPANATVDLYYSSSNPEIASIDIRTGEITAYDFGNVTFCVRDAYTNLSDCKTVRIITPPKVCVTYNVETTGETFVLNGREFYTKAEYNGVDITNDIEYNDPGWSIGQYDFPESGYQTICYTLNVTKTNGVYSCGIPGMTFTTQAFGSNVAAVEFEEADPVLNATIGAKAFSGTPYIEEVIIPDGWKLDYDSGYKGQQFFCCGNIKRVSLGNGVTGVGYGTFSNNPNLSSVTMTDNLVYLGAFAFTDATSLSAVTLSKNLQSISSSFSGCTSLKEIYLPNTIQYIGQDAFYGCTSLTDVHFQDYSATIGLRMFYNCYSLTGITVGDGETNVFTDNFHYIASRNAFTNCFSGTTWMTFNIEEPSDDMYNIAGYKTFPLYIPCDAYLPYSEYYQTKFSGNNIPGRLMPIGGEWCGPTAYTIEVTYYITGTTEEAVVAIADSYGAYSLGVSKIYLEDGTILFSGDSVPPSSSVTYAFTETGNTNVLFDFKSKNVNFYRRLPGSAKVISVPSTVKSFGLGGNAGVETIVMASGATSVNLTGCTAFTTINLPTSVTSCTFGNCTSLESIAIPSSVNTISEKCFTNCTSLSAVTIPDSVTGFSSQAFYYCTSLKTITIPSSVRYLGNQCFYGAGLETIYAYPTTAPSMGKDSYNYPNAFEWIKTGGTLYYPSGSNYSSWLANSNYCLGKYGWTGSGTL